MRFLPSLHLGSFAIALSGAVMPGLLFTVTVREAARDGLWVGPLLILGHGILELALVMALVLGLAALLSRPAVLGSIGVVSGVVPVWMAWGMLRGLPPGLRLTLEAAEGAPRGNRLLVGACSLVLLWFGLAFLWSGAVARHRVS
ncbi:MAG: LysE family transporter [Deltaproteobacteria bacterium]|nr:LysE family transporter [Deltaproteobacteria bacterium]